MTKLTLVVKEPTSLGPWLRIGIFIVCMGNYLAGIDSIRTSDVGGVIFFFVFGYLCQLIAAYGRFDFWRGMDVD